MPHYAMIVRIFLGPKKFERLENTKFHPDHLVKGEMKLGSQGVILRKIKPGRYCVIAPAPDMLAEFLTILGYRVNKNYLGKLGKKYTKVQIANSQDIEKISILKISGKNNNPSIVTGHEFPDDPPPQPEPQPDPPMDPPADTSTFKLLPSKYDITRRILAIVFFKIDEYPPVFRPHFGTMRIAGYLNRLRHPQNALISNKEAVATAKAALEFLRENWELICNNPENKAEREFTRFAKLLKLKSGCKDFSGFLAKCKKISSTVCGRGDSFLPEELEKSI